MFQAHFLLRCTRTTSNVGNSGLTIAAASRQTFSMDRLDLQRRVVSSPIWVKKWLASTKANLVQTDACWDQTGQTSKPADFATREKPVQNHPGLMHSNICLVAAQCLACEQADELLLARKTGF